MKLLFLLTIFFSYSCVWAQENETKFKIPVANSFEACQKLNNTAVEEFAAQKIKSARNAFAAPAIERKPEKARFTFLEAENKRRVEEKDSNETDESDKTDVKDTSGGNNPSQIEDKEKFHWKPALIQSGIFLGIQHGFRLTEKRTQRELGGPFFRDWAQSVKNLRGWEDGDSIFINYVAHPLQGSLTGRIFVNNSDRAKKQEFGKSKEYWKSRFKAMIWSAASDIQFELGPISEASIGNVGLNKKNGYSTMAYVDLVVTPIAGTGVLIGEDAIDKYILKNWLERKNGSKTKIKILRSILTPTTSFANILRGKVPWKRDNRQL